MIDVTPFTDKLDKLREYMPLWIDYNLYSNVNVVLDLYFSTGFLIYTQKPFHPSFEEWIQLNTTNTFNQ